MRATSSRFAAPRDGSAGSLSCSKKKARWCLSPLDQTAAGTSWQKSFCGNVFWWHKRQLALVSTYWAKVLPVASARIAAIEADMVAVCGMRRKSNGLCSNYHTRAWQLRGTAHLKRSISKLLKQRLAQ